MMGVPYLWIALAAVWAASLAGVGVWQHGAGKHAQRAADQAQFDKINTDIAQQKADANAQLRAALESSIAAAQQQAETQSRLEQDHVEHQAVTDDLRKRLAGERLRFAAAQGSRCGGGGHGAVPEAASSARPAETAVCELSAEAASALREIAVDADRLADDYRLCFGFVQTLLPSGKHDG